MLSWRSVLFESCSANPKVYYQPLLAQMLLAVSEAFISVVIFWSLFLELILLVVGLVLLWDCRRLWNQCSFRIQLILISKIIIINVCIFIGNISLSKTLITHCLPLRRPSTPAWVSSLSFYFFLDSWPCEFFKIINCIF